MATKKKKQGIRVRMYRVGFGDFFLLTVPGKAGPEHILIDCGVHAGNIGSMAQCVADLATETDRKLALVIVTHFHADHLSGFASQAAEFEKFTVGAVWITNRLDPEDKQGMRFKANLAEVATRVGQQLRMRLAAGGGSEEEQVHAELALDKVENALGVNGSGNDLAMEVVTERFKNKPPVFYYEAGDTPTLPEELKGVLTAEILSPAPKKLAGQFSAEDNKNAQYLAAAGESVLQAGCFSPFEREWPATADDYQGKDVLKAWKTRGDFEKQLKDLQPDALAAAAEVIDGTLNNQSLVVLFTCKGKKLLFVGDAQWGNWAYWLYGKPVKGADPGILSKARQLLESIDFYKVGHHGSTNATPIPAAAALGHQCVAMCSTEIGEGKKKRTYGSIANDSEVPRIPLMEALKKLTGNKVARSDWIPVTVTKKGKPPEEVAFSKEARKQVPSLPKIFSKGSVYIDYEIPLPQ